MQKDCSVHTDMNINSLLKKYFVPNETSTMIETFDKDINPDEVVDDRTDCAEEFNDLFIDAGPGQYINAFLHGLRGHVFG